MAISDFDGAKAFSKSEIRYIQSEVEGGPGDAKPTKDRQVSKKGLTIFRCSFKTLYQLALGGIQAIAE